MRSTFIRANGAETGRNRARFSSLWGRVGILRVSLEVIALAKSATAVVVLSAISAVLAPAYAQVPGSGPLKGAAQTSTPAASVPSPSKGAVSGQAVPRFVSLKSDRVHMRSGPGMDHAIQWVYSRAGLPIEVIGEADAWRRVRDSEGAVGWVLASLLSGRRTVLIEPWSHKGAATPPQVPLRADAREASLPVAQIEAGVIAGVRTCDGRWCEVTVAEYRGYVEQHRLWGVYKGESVR